MAKTGVGLILAIFHCLLYASITRKGCLGMTRAECEKKVLALLGQIAEVCEEYHPGMLVSMSFSKSGHLRAFAFDDNDATNYLLDAIRFTDGTVKIDGKYIRSDGSVL